MAHDIKPGDVKVYSGSTWTLYRGRFFRVMGPAFTAASGETAFRCKETLDGGRTVVGPNFYIVAEELQ